MYFGCVLHTQFFTESTLSKKLIKLSKVPKVSEVPILQLKQKQKQSRPENYRKSLLLKRKKKKAKVPK